MGEGFTPLIRADRLAHELGLGEVYVKDEGGNPTGTFKDRGASVAISRWKELGVTKFSQPTVGSAGNAWAAYGARAGVEIHTGMPVGCPEIGWKMCFLNGAHVYLVDGGIADAFRIMKEGAERHGWLNVGGLREPYRVEGKKTMGIEIAEQLSWELPDAILYPTGGGIGIIGMWKVFDELGSLGWISVRRPRLVSVQSKGGSIVEAFHAGREECEVLPDMPTIAPGIMVLKPFGDFLILRALRETKGWAVAVGDDEMRHFMTWVARNEGILLSPEGAATVAGARLMVRQGQLDRTHRVVLFNTATSLRYPHLIQAKIPTIPGTGNIDLIAAA
jgi:threonine synthase